MDEMIDGKTLKQWEAEKRIASDRLDRVREAMSAIMIARTLIRTAQALAGFDDPRLDQARSKLFDNWLLLKDVTDAQYAIYDEARKALETEKP